MLIRSSWEPDLHYTAGGLFFVYSWSTLIDYMRAKKIFSNESVEEISSMIYLKAVLFFFPVFDDNQVLEIL